MKARECGLFLCVIFCLQKVTKIYCKVLQKVTKNPIKYLQ